MKTLQAQLNSLKKRANQFENPFLESILEGFIDGLLILTPAGDLHYANGLAHDILGRFYQLPNQAGLIDQEVNRIHRAVIDSQQWHPEQYHTDPNRLKTATHSQHRDRQSPHYPTVVIESELDFEPAGRLRLRARWSPLSLEITELSMPPMIWLTIEDQQRSLQAQALLDVERYGFTARESEIWLRRKAQVPYRDIAQELFITVNTVKKHVKNIRVKVEDYRFRQEMRMAN